MRWIRRRIDQINPIRMDNSEISKQRFAKPLRYRVLLLFRRMIYGIFNTVARLLHSRRRKFLYEDLPKSLFDNILEMVKHYAVSLIGIKTGNEGEEAVFLGSGTFVKIEDKFCILTAGHVLDNRTFEKSDKIGLCFMQTRHEFKLPRTELIKSCLRGRGKSEDGPDLGILVLPWNRTGNIVARKQFWNLRHYRDKVFDDQFGDLGVWAALGAVHELTKMSGPEAGYGSTFHFSHFLWYGPIKKKRGRTSGDFDYVELTINHRLNPEIPKKFGGLSGAGLWHIPLFQDDIGEIKCGNPILAGVTFYQSKIRRGISRLRHHGKHSLYNKLLDIFNTDEMKITPA